MRDLLELAERSVRKGGVGGRLVNVLSECNARRGAALRFGNIARSSPQKSGPIGALSRQDGGAERRRKLRFDQWAAVRPSACGLLSTQRKRCPLLATFAVQAFPRAQTLPNMY